MAKRLVRLSEKTFPTFCFIAEINGTRWAQKTSEKSACTDLKATCGNKSRTWGTFFRNLRKHFPTWGNICRTHGTFQSSFSRVPVCLTATYGYAKHFQAAQEANKRP